MLRLTQVYNMIPKRESKDFAVIFNDISDVMELGYTAKEVCEDFLLDHFGLEITCEKQLNDFTADILKYQGQMEEKCKALDIILGRY